MIPGTVGGSAEELESVFSNLLWRGLVLALCTRSARAGLEEDTFKRDIVLSKVEEHLSSNFLGHFKGPVNPMVAIKQDLRLHNRNQSIVLHNQVTNWLNKY